VSCSNSLRRSDDGEVAHDADLFGVGAGDERVMQHVDAVH